MTAKGFSVSAFIAVLLLFIAAVAADPTCTSVTNSTLQAYLAAFPYCDTHVSTLAARGQVLFFVPAVPGDANFNSSLVTYGSIAGATRIFAHKYTSLPSLRLNNRTSVNYLWRWACAQLFRPCVVIQGNGFPQAPPRSMCDDLSLNDNIALKVRLFLTGANQSTAAAFLTPDCASNETGIAAAGSDPRIAGQPRFPPDGTAQVWTVSPAPNVTVQIPVPAYAAYPVTVRPSANFTCNWPWHVAPAKYHVEYCDRACPLPLFSISQYRAIAILTAVLSWAGYFLTLALLVTMLLIKRYRDYPASLVPFAVLGSNIIAFAFIFNMTWGWQDMICRDPVTFREGRSNHNGHCVFVALVTQFGALITPCFWCAIAVNSFIAIFLKKDYVFKNRFAQPVTHLLCWGLPAVTCAVALGIDRMGAPQLVVFCWIFDPIPQIGYQKDFSVQYPLFFIPLGLMLVIGLVCIAMVLWEMRNIGQSQGEFRYSKQIRLGAFLLIFWLLYLWTFLYRAIITAKKNHWTDIQAVWYRAGINSPNVQRKGGPSVGLPISFHIVAGVQGIAITLLFGSSREVLDFWTERIRNIKEGRSFLAGMSTGFTSDGQKGVSSIRKTEVSAGGGGVFSEGGGGSA